MAPLGVEVALSDLGSVLHLFHEIWVDFFARFLGFLPLLVPELAVIHDSANGRCGVRGHLDEVEIENAGDSSASGTALIPN